MITVTQFFLNLLSLTNVKFRAEEGHGVFKSFIISIFFISSLYVLTTLICGPDDAIQLSEVSAAISPLPLLFITVYMQIFRTYFFWNLAKKNWGERII